MGGDEDEDEGNSSYSVPTVWIVLEGDLIMHSLEYKEALGRDTLRQFGELPTCLTFRFC